MESSSISFLSNKNVRLVLLEKFEKLASPSSLTNVYAVNPQCLEAPVEGLNPFLPVEVPCLEVVILFKP